MRKDNYEKNVNWYSTRRIIIIYNSVIYCAHETHERQTQGEVPWSYWGSKSESNWGKRFKQCTGKYQSPININTSNVVVNHDLDIKYINYDVELDEPVLFNNGFGGKFNRIFNIRSCKYWYFVYKNHIFHNQ